MSITLNSPHNQTAQSHSLPANTGLLSECALRHANSGWTSAADGTLEERVYYCQNWRADVSVVLSSGGLVKEWIKYSAYGVPYSITPGDFDTDGFLTGNDSDEFDAAYNGGAGAWDARVDLNLDGSLTSADVTIFTDEFNNGEAAGYGVLSRSMVANRIGYAGYQHAPELAGTKWHVRHRVLDSETGRWTRRDPLGYVDGVDLYEYVNGMAICTQDPQGLACTAAQGACQGSGGPPVETLPVIVTPSRARWCYVTASGEIVCCTTVVATGATICCVAGVFGLLGYCVSDYLVPPIKPLPPTQIPRDRDACNALYQLYHAACQTVANDACRCDPLMPCPQLQYCRAQHAACANARIAHRDAGCWRGRSPDYKRRHQESIDHHQTAANDCGRIYGEIGCGDEAND